MAQSRVYTLLVDSNVRTHVNKTSVRANPQMRAAQIISCGHVGVFRETLGKTRGESNVLIVSCMTNFLTDAEGPESVSQRIDPVLQDVREILDEFSSISAPYISYSFEFNPCTDGSRKS